MNNTGTICMSLYPHNMGTVYSHVTFGNCAYTRRDPHLLALHTIYNFSAITIRGKNIEPGAFLPERGHGSLVTLITRTRTNAEKSSLGPKYFR